MAGSISSIPNVWEKNLKADEELGQQGPIAIPHSMHTAPSHGSKKWVRSKSVIAIAVLTILSLILGARLISLKPFTKEPVRALNAEWLFFTYTNGGCNPQLQPPPIQYGGLDYGPCTALDPGNPVRSVSGHTNQQTRVRFYSANGCANANQIGEIYRDQAGCIVFPQNRPATHYRAIQA